MKVTNYFFFQINNSLKCRYLNNFNNPLIHLVIIIVKNKIAISSVKYTLYYSLSINFKSVQITKYLHYCYQLHIMFGINVDAFYLFK